MFWKFPIRNETNTRIYLGRITATTAVVEHGGTGYRHDECLPNKFKWENIYSMDDQRSAFIIIVIIIGRHPRHIQYFILYHIFFCLAHWLLNHIQSHFFHCRSCCDFFFWITEGRKKSAQMIQLRLTQCRYFFIEILYREFRVWEKEKHTTSTAKLTNINQFVSAFFAKWTRMWVKKWVFVRRDVFFYTHFNYKHAPFFYCTLIPFFSQLYLRVCLEFANETFFQHRALNQ